MALKCKMEKKSSLTLAADKNGNIIIINVSGEHIGFRALYSEGYEKLN